MSLKNKIRKSESSDNDASTAWLVSLADLLSLILTFFVLVYSMSEIPHKKWTEYSSSIVEYLTGNKLNIFKKEMIVTESTKSKKIARKKAIQPTYIVTLLKDMKINNKPIDRFIDYQQIDNNLLIGLDKDMISIEGTNMELTEEGTKIFLTLSKIFPTLSNQILVNYSSEDYFKSVQISDFIARKIEEFGYEYKVLRGIYFYNPDLGESEINDNFQIVIKVNETIF